MFFSKNNHVEYDAEQLGANSPHECNFRLKTSFTGMHAAELSKGLDNLLHVFGCLVMSDSATPWTVAHQTPLSMGFSSENTGEVCHFLF